MTTNTAPIGHNGGPELEPYEAIRKEIEDLYGEAKNWADGEAIANQEQHDEIEKLYDMLHEAGKRADDARKEEARPHDEAKAAIQEKYNILIGNTKSVKGRVPMGKEALSALLTPWRNRIAAEKEAAAKAAREEADRLSREAQAAMQASRGNLEEREKAEALVTEARKVETFAKRADKAATTGTGLRTVWHCTLEDESKALDWAYGRAPEQFRALVQSMAEGVVRGGMRSVPGFKVWDERVAA